MERAQSKDTCKQKWNVDLDLFLNSFSVSKNYLNTTKLSIPFLDICPREIKAMSTQTGTFTVALFLTDESCKQLKYTQQGSR